MFTVRSRIHDYSVEQFPDLAAVLQSIIPTGSDVVFLVDQCVGELYRGELEAHLSPARVTYIEATEDQKTLERLAPVFLSLLAKSVHRDTRLVVIGGGVLQDIGCFIASVLFRGIAWELVPTTLLAQADSCIGSKSSINIGQYKNQIGTFYPPHRVLLTSSFLDTLPWDEVRSGLGEIIKLQLLAGEPEFQGLMRDLSGFENQRGILDKWVERSLAVKKEYIEQDEFDRGLRNLLNYGHTFGHAYESAANYAIPHGIAVLLGIVTATYLSAGRGLITNEAYRDLRRTLAPWYQPFDTVLKKSSRDAIFRAIARDKKNTRGAVNCILTRGPGRMEKMPLALETELIPALTAFFEQELT
ncbi:MAG: AroB-related putative sugar phosphate phospholyase (cyclizing) [Chthoniobacterales bacterium]